jgi:hypothetical protein
VPDDGLPIHTLTKREYDAARNGDTPAPADARDAPVRRRPGRPAKGKRNRERRRWPPGRSCDHCGAPLSEYQSRYCSNACRYPDRQVSMSSATVTAPQIAPDGQDGDDSSVLPLAFLDSLPRIVLALEVEGWRLTRTS